MATQTENGERTLVLKYTPECRKQVFFVRGNALIREEIEEEADNGVVVTKMRIKPLVTGTEVEVRVSCHGLTEVHRISWD